VTVVNFSGGGIREVQITAANLASLKETLQALTALRELDFAVTNIGDKGLEQLQELTRLQDLDLRNTKITDAGLSYLEGLTNLRRLDLEEKRRALSI
jgi:Leucine-rich repeat (LRR) protein